MLLSNASAALPQLPYFAKALVSSLGLFPLSALCVNWGNSLTLLKELLQSAAWDQVAFAHPN